MSSKHRFTFFSITLLLILGSFECANAQTFDTTPEARRLASRVIEEGHRVTLRGNTRPEVRGWHDGGAVRENFPLKHMLLQLRRPPERERALQQFIDELHTAGSSNFHQWISADEFGTRFGPAKQDLETLTNWLESYGFKVNVVYPSGMVIDFSGNAGQVRRAFHTEIHHIEVGGKKHIANTRDPQIPAALAPLIIGIVSLHDFKPHALHHMRQAKPEFTFSDLFGGTSLAVAPADLATIYNLNPLFSAGYSGQGQTIALIEDTDVFSASDWSTFRTAFGLSAYNSASFTTVHPTPPTGSNNCGAPGVIAPNDAEAILDAEWTSAAAPGAAVEMAACADTTTTFGGLIAIQNLINGNSPPPIMSISYGQCETVNGAAANAAYNAAYQQAVAEGVSVFVAAGDSGAAGCDNSVAEATHGIGANAFASTPYNVAVGGTDFSDTYSGSNDTYWNSNNTATYGSALSYIPEIPWNDSCAGALLVQYLGYPTTYGASSLCNDPIFGPLVESTVAGGGAPSGCATGAPSTAGVVSGSCQGWAKPSWQAVLGNPNDGVRDTPDVSLFAADGLWSHFYVFCWSDTRNGGAACSGSPDGWSAAGGTSFAAPIMAGIQALVNQKTGSRQGNPNPAYYQLAASEYGSIGNVSCNSSNGNTVSPSCIFYDVTLGDMDVDCVGPNCYLGGGSVGVLSTSNTAFVPSYRAEVGWDFATGIGTINASNLVNNWPSSQATPDFVLSPSPTNLTIMRGGSGTSTITIAAQNGFNGNVSLSASGLPSGVTASFNPSSATSSSTLTLTASSTATTGTATVTITGTSGSLSNSTPLSLTVNPAPVPSFTLSASPSSLTVAQGGSGTSTITIAPQNGFNGNVSLSASGLPGGVTASFNPSSATSSSTLTLTASSTATTGTATVTITGTSGSLSNSTPLSLTVNPAPVPSFTLSASPSSLTIAQGASGTSTITIAPQNGFSGNVSLAASGLPSGVTASFNPSSATSTSTVTLTASSTASTGTATVTISGTSGSLSNSTALSLTVQATTITTLPSVWTDVDIGAPAAAGSASYANNVFTVNGAGTQIYGSADTFNFVYQPLSGDGSITARVLSLQGGSGSVSAGVMLRETLSPGSTNAKTADWRTYGAIYFDLRTSTGGSTTEPGSVSATLPYWVKVSRSGSSFSSYVSVDGVNWVQVGTGQTINMAQSIYIGLAVNSGSNSTLATASFDNVSVSSAAAPAPVISSLSATTGTIGSPVTITGSGFGSTQGSSVVLLNGTSATVNSWSATSIGITIPAGATSGPLVVSVAPSMNDSNPVTFTVTSQPLPSGWLDQDVGSVGVAGNGSFSNGTFTVKGGGAQIYGAADSFHYVYQPLSGDGTIMARVASLQGGSGFASAGVMIRETLSPGSSNAKTAYWSTYGRIYFDLRTTTGGSTSEPGSVSATLPYWVKVSRSGNTFTSYASADGATWVQLGTAQTINMAQSVDIGLAVNSGSTSALATATFDNVSVTSP